VVDVGGMRECIQSTYPIALFARENTAIIKKYRMLLCGKNQSNATTANQVLLIILYYIALFDSVGNYLNCKFSI